LDVQSLYLFFPNPNNEINAKYSTRFKKGWIGKPQSSSQKQNSCSIHDTSQTPKKLCKKNPLDSRLLFNKNLD